MTEQVRILLPCGIGDVYWALVKFRAFCRKHGIKLPPKVAIITTTPEARYAGSEFRSIEFLKMVPFVEVDDPPNQEAYPTKAFPSLEGRNLLDYKDAAGTFLVKQMNEKTEKTGSAWVDYYWPRPGSAEQVKKRAYVRRVLVNGEVLIVGAGLYAGPEQ